VVLFACTFLVTTTSHGVTTTVPKGLPLYQFVNTGVEPLPWNAVALGAKLDNTTMLGSPHGATSATEGVLAYRTTENDLALFTQNASGTTSWIDLTSGNNVPPPSANPVPFFDPMGNTDVVYVDQAGHVIVVSPNEPDTPSWPHRHDGATWRPYVATDLSALTGVTAARGLVSIQLSGSTGTVAYRTSSDAIEVLTLSWAGPDPIPVFNQSDYTISTGTFTTSPVVLPGQTPEFASTLANGDLIVYSATGSTLSAWTSQNVTLSTNSLTLRSPLSLASTGSTIDLAALSASGDVELFTTTYDNAPPSTTVAVVPSSWSAQNVTAMTPGAPPLDGTLSIQLTSSLVAIAGQAANWGDLFVLTNPVTTSTWSATDVSVTAGSAARTVANSVTGLSLNGELTLYAAGINTPPPQGVGVYAIPSSKWSTAITNGWPIISETGGLGTQSAPWVGFVGTTNVASSSDYLMGQAIYNSHRRVTWLSFWTVSGPLAGQAKTPANYYSHGFDAGVWVATQIDTYRSLGVGLKPDWVILDPEGYPDDHSNLDAPGGSSKATLALYATYWSAMLKGWQNGLNSVDPSLNAGVYSSQSEYADYQLSSLNLPVFIAVAFADGGPVPVPGATGSNVRGFISFDASCSPKSTLASEEATLLDPPWSGQFNTLQFNAGVYCSPP
jgi:hypothetical protein